MGHDDDAVHQRAQHYGQRQGAHRAVDHRLHRAALPAKLRRPGHSEQGEAERRGGSHPGHGANPDDLEQGVAVHDAGERAHAGAVAAGPRCARRTNMRAATIRITAVTTIGPMAPVPNSRVTPYVSAPMHAAAGRVSTHATTMLPATPQRTADSRLAAPEPITAPEMVWVVESGKPTCEAARITAAPAPWAAKPWAESILWIRLPIVRMIRQPPT